MNNHQRMEREHHKYTQETMCNVLRVYGSHIARAKELEPRLVCWKAEKGVGAVV